MWQTERSCITFYGKNMLNFQHFQIEKKKQKLVNVSINEEKYIYHHNLIAHDFRFEEIRKQNT
jgi:hypothetical protein